MINKLKNEIINQIISNEGTGKPLSIKIPDKVSYREANSIVEYYSSTIEGKKEIEAAKQQQQDMVGGPICNILIKNYRKH